jgi:hypothetical protein
MDVRHFSTDIDSVRLLFCMQQIHSYWRSSNLTERKAGKAITWACGLDRICAEETTDDDLHMLSWQDQCSPEQVIAAALVRSQFNAG